ncbi:histidine kinase [Kribbella sp. NPDC054772]
MRVEQGQRLERERIAREMHDALGHRLSLLSMAAWLPWVAYDDGRD